MLTALQLIKSNGIQGASMADISSVSGVAVGTIYHHFDSRESLIDALRAQVAEQLAQALSAGIQSKGTPKDKIMGLWNNAWAFFVKNQLAASFLDQYATTALGATANGMLKSKELAGVNDLLKDAIKQGKVRKVEPELLFEWMMAAILTTLRVSNNKNMSSLSKKSIEAGAEMCWAAFKA